MSNASIHGSCGCRRVRFEAQFPSRFVSHCHCENCRRAHGAAFVTFAGFLAEQVTVTTGSELLRRFLTEKNSTRTFCTNCGSTIFYEGPDYPGEIHAAVGNLEGELDRAPSNHAFSVEAPDWCPITDDLPRTS